MYIRCQISLCFVAVCWGDSVSLIMPTTDLEVVFLYILIAVVIFVAIITIFFVGDIVVRCCERHTRCCLVLPEGRNSPYMAVARSSDVETTV